MADEKICIMTAERSDKLKSKSLVNNLVDRMSQLDAQDVLKEINKLKSNKEKSKRSIYKKDSMLFRLRRAFVNPFSVVLFVIATISMLTDFFLPSEINQNKSTVIIILIMLLVSGLVRFMQEIKAKRTTDRLNMLINTKVSVFKNDKFIEAESEDIEKGDLVRLKAGDRAPADIRIIWAEDCYVNEASLTGESGVKEKTSKRLTRKPDSLNDYTNIIFTGTTVTGGCCEGVALALGKDSVYSNVDTAISTSKNGFDIGAYSISWVLIKFMLFLIPIVFVANGITKGNWIVAFLFSISVAVGLTPELLPMVITACMSKSSKSMSKKQTVVKNINAMQSFGAMDILCVDKTGTLTGDKLVLEYYMDIVGNESEEVLDCAYINSFLNSSIENNIDSSILKLKEIPNKLKHYENLCERIKKLDELPFDYQRKSSGVLIERESSKYLLVKGDIESVVKRCKNAYYRGELIPNSTEMLKSVESVVDEMLDDGMKVIAVAFKETSKSQIEIEDENDLTLLGYICFFDAPLSTAEGAIDKLKDLKISVKVLTGDNKKVTRSICKRLKIQIDDMITGEELENLSNDELLFKAENTSVFCELTPSQKKLIVDTLKQNGHTVGFLGDGMNDLPAVSCADVGISVGSACETLKESADVVLLKKDLNVLYEGVEQGRKAFANMLKYINITASSNLGNICAIVFASIFLPFTPMTSLQLLLLNLLYDILCLILPWDKVDRDMCTKPLKWSGQSLPKFMVTFGSISTVFDLVTFAFLFFFLCPHICGGYFGELNLLSQAKVISLCQTGWFLESMWTQILILYLLRTKNRHIIKSMPSNPVLIVTLIGIVVFTALPFTVLGTLMGMSNMPPFYFLFLLVIVSLYLLTVTVVKIFYLKNRKNIY